MMREVWCVRWIRLKRADSARERRIVTEIKKSVRETREEVASLEIGTIQFMLEIDQRKISQW